MSLISNCVLCTGVWLLAGQYVAGQDNTTVSSSHFIVVGEGQNKAALDNVLRQCEEARVELTKTLGITECLEGWSPKCLVQVHPTRNSYIKTVGHAGAQTEGCSQIQLSTSGVAGRRIDLLPNGKGEVTALRHELTHVILADRFGGQPPPHWFDEGVAMLSDRREKQLLHLRDCFDVVGTRRALPLTKLFTLEQFSNVEQMAPFYGQSLTLVMMLAEKRSVSVLVDFAKDARSIGHEEALRKHYQIADIRSLENEWQTSVRSRMKSPTLTGFSSHSPMDR